MSTKSTIVSGLGSILGILIGCCVYAATVLADESAGGVPGGRLQQAYDACRDKKAGDVVQFATPNGRQVAATCADSPKGLYARPGSGPQERESGTASQG